MGWVNKNSLLNELQIIFEEDIYLPTFYWRAYKIGRSDSPVEEEYESHTVKFGIEATYLNEERIGFIRISLPDGFGEIEDITQGLSYRTVVDGVPPSSVTREAIKIADELVAQLKKREDFTQTAKVGAKRPYVTEIKTEDL